MQSLYLTSSAKKDIQEHFDWWSEIRSKEQACNWLRSLDVSINSLSSDPNSYPLVRERKLALNGYRQLNIGLSNRKTHRVVFLIQIEKVVVLRVRHLAQNNLTKIDLMEDQLLNIKQLDMKEAGGEL